MDRLKYPIGIQTFEKIRQEKYIYVDKTEYIYNLVTQNAYYFLSRPRRFGKSMLLSTIEALFKGKRDLFVGLAIDSKNWAWEQHEVLHLDFNGENFRQEKALDIFLDTLLKKLERQYSIEYPEGSFGFRFREIIEAAYRKSGKQVVILIDEYDKPLFDVFRSKSLLEYNRNQLQSFFSVLKTMDQYIKFGMLTGVTRFSKVSVFSGLNNLNDISLDEEYNSICGINEAELSNYFSESIQEMSEKANSLPEKIRDELKKNYDGYHFAPYGEDIYNPYSILSTFSKKKFRDYWYASGTPGELVHLLEDSTFPVPEMDKCRCSEDEMMGTDIYLKNPVPLFYQCGYLTIKDYDSEFKEFTLSFPNMEVSRGFSQSLMRSYMNGLNASSKINDFVRAVRKGDAEEFMRMLESFTAGIPYDLVKPSGVKDFNMSDIPDEEGWIKGGMEAHYQNVMYVLFKLMGFYTQAECRTSNGRIDLTIETSDYVYIMEFKIDSIPEKALHQIKDSDYFLPYRHCGKKIIKIGANFDTTKCRLSSWIIE
ncbi:MAG: ATP-binding protein [Muribaculaceae bacterium]|nr:ATP-binding protein [Muribaculaceae bacterium]